MRPIPGGPGRPDPTSVPRGYPASPKTLGWGGIFWRAIFTGLVSYPPLELSRLVWYYPQQYAHQGVFYGAFALEMAVILIGWIMALALIWERKP